MMVTVALLLCGAAVAATMGARRFARFGRAMGSAEKAADLPPARKRTVFDLFTAAHVWTALALFLAFAAGVAAFQP
jgi:hypothetical protein